MSQERLSALSVLSIEAEIAAGVSYDTILKRFREAKAEKFAFFNVFVRVILLLIHITINNKTYLLLLNITIIYNEN